ncbi:hypothetical protein HG530_005614 [Fusarium avenaceum]|nr:hypothetical protein HG530_005614 [Fusarium avenaceum]
MANGNTVPPVPPMAIANPIEETWILAGRSFAVTMTAPGNKGPRKNPRKATAIAETMNFGTSQNNSWRPMQMARYIERHRRSPKRSVTKPSVARPRAIPAQKPVPDAPEAYAEAFRTRSMKVTTQPPRPTVESNPAETTIDVAISGANNAPSE